VPEDRPRDVAVFELGDGDFAGEGAVGAVEDVLGCDFDARAQVLAGQEEVEGGWGDDDFGLAVAGGFVEVVDDVFYGVDCAVPSKIRRLVREVGSVLWAVHFEVAADEELATHFGGVGSLCCWWVDGTWFGCIWYTWSGFNGLI
jgi:hypothetical protein